MKNTTSTQFMTRLQRHCKTREKLGLGIIDINTHVIKLIASIDQSKLEQNEKINITNFINILQNDFKNKLYDYTTARNCGSERTETIWRELCNVIENMYIFNNNNYVNQITVNILDDIYNFIK